MVQKFLPDVKDGDKRVCWSTATMRGAVNRVPAADDLRSNMVRRLAEGDRTDAARARDLRAARPHLRERGLLLVGIDVIGGWLTEINVTSPTGIRAVKNVGGRISQDRVGQDRAKRARLKPLRQQVATIVTIYTMHPHSG